MKKIMLGIFGLTLAVACNSGESDAKVENTEVQKAVSIVQEDITVEQASEMIKNGDVIVIDVRSEDEYSSGHIDGAIIVDINSVGFEEGLAELDKSKKYIVYCHSGKRSARSSYIMADSGFENIYNVLGGISAWKASGYDVISE